MLRKATVRIVILFLIGLTVSSCFLLDYGSAISNSDRQTYQIGEQPRVDIYNITGGYGVHATLKNCISLELTNVEWSITITGGIFNLIHKVKSNTVPVFYPNQEINIYSGIFFGWGTIEIRIIADLRSEFCDGAQHLFRTSVSHLPL
jgi:hypothetical protein